MPWGSILPRRLEGVEYRNDVLHAVPVDPLRRPPSQLAEQCQVRGVDSADRLSSTSTISKSGSALCFQRSEYKRRCGTSLNLRGRARARSGERKVFV